MQRKYIKTHKQQQIQLQREGLKVSHSLPQQFEDSLVKREFERIHDENTRPEDRRRRTSVIQGVHIVVDHFSTWTQVSA